MDKPVTQLNRLNYWLDHSKLNYYTSDLRHSIHTKPYKIASISEYTNYTIT